MTYTGNLIVTVTVSLQSFVKSYLVKWISFCYRVNWAGRPGTDFMHEMSS